MLESSRRSVISRRLRWPHFTLAQLQPLLLSSDTSFPLPPVDTANCTRCIICIQCLKSLTRSIGRGAHEYPHRPVPPDFQRNSSHETMPYSGTKQQSRWRNTRVRTTLLSTKAIYVSSASCVPHRNRTGRDLLSYRHLSPDCLLLALRSGLRALSGKERC
jgi:hypothetical protein